MATRKALRHERIYFINTTPSKDSPNWALFGNGINSLSSDMGSTVEDDQYIIYKNATHTRTATSKTQSFSGDMIVSEEAQDFILSLTWAIGSEAETEWVEVDLFKDPDASGKYPARKVAVLVDVQNDGSGDAGDSLQIEGSINWLNDPVEGTWDKAAKTFTATTTSD